MPAPSKIVKTYPRKGDMQQFRLEQLAEFICVRCGKSKTSRLVVVQNDDWAKLLCNGCYGELLSKNRSGRK